MSNSYSFTLSYAITPISFAWRHHEHWTGLASDVLPEVHSISIAAFNVWNQFHSQSCTFSLFVWFFLLGLSAAIATYLSDALHSVKRMGGFLSNRIKTCLWRMKPNLFPFLDAVKIAISHPTTQRHSNEKTKKYLQPGQPTAENAINTIAVVAEKTAVSTIRIIIYLRLQ